MTDQEKIEKLSALIKEVMQWHADPNSSEYNECDTAPCFWCEQAKELGIKND